MDQAPKQHDVIIIGGGPAGMSAAIWCADLGIKPLLIEREPALGGQLFWTHNPITNYLGLNAQDGAQLASRFTEHVERAGIEILTCEVTSVDLATRRLVVDGASYSADSIVIATGIRRRRLGVPGEKEFAGRGMLVSGARDRELARGKKVVIVGGGDAALENAIILSDIAASVVVVHRRGELAARAEFLEKARQRANVSFVLDSVVTAIQGTDDIENVMVEKTAGETSTITCDAVLIRIGVEPNTELFAGEIDVDHRGYVVVDKEFRTSAAGVWAVGDVASPNAMTIANAVGSASVAAKWIVNS